MPASFSLELPTQNVDQPEELVTGAAIADVARAAEDAGFAAVHVTDHPAPDTKWLDTGGHHALDPFVALSFAAAATTTLRLLTNIYVAAYRNPFLGAKSIHSLDVLSANRLIIGTAAGYLKPEYAALGADFENRGARLDDALDVMKRLFTGDDVVHDGVGYNARGVRFRPTTRGGGHPPVWIGGNSKPAIRRAVARWQGWSPFMTAGYAKGSRTAEIDGLEDLRDAIAWARKHAAEIGRTEPLDICFSAGTMIDGTRSVDERRAVLQSLEDAGVTWLTVAMPGTTRAEVIANAQAFARDFIAP